MQHAGEAVRTALAKLRAAVEPGAEEREARFRADEESVRRADRERRLRDAGAALAPPMLHAIALGRSPSATESGRAVVAWLRDPRAERVLVLSGGTGCGKTVASSWAIAQSSRGGRVRSASVIAQGWRSGGFTAADGRRELAECGLLVIDDAGAEHQQHREWLAVALRDLLELRQGADLRTIITTNLTRTALIAALNDPRVTSRLSLARWSVDSGADRRVKP